MAVREVEFNILKEEAKHKEATVRIEAELKTKLAQRKLKLEQLEAKKQIEIARAKLSAYQEVKEFTDELDSVEDDPLDTSPIPIDLISRRKLRPYISLKNADIQHQMETLQIQPRSPLTSVRTSINFPWKVKPTIQFTFNHKRHQRT